MLFNLYLNSVLYTLFRIAILHHGAILSFYGSMNSFLEVRCFEINLNSPSTQPHPGNLRALYYFGSDITCSHVEVFLTPFSWSVFGDRSAYIVTVNASEVMHVYRTPTLLVLSSLHGCGRDCGTT